MKLHNLSVIFIVIAIPLILITSYYISLQIDTINMQTTYNTKLLDSTKEAIDAFEINTVEWNANYSETADSKRRDVMASINTFTTSFANNIGVGGTSKEYIFAYMPAIAYTLYDGYYIYSPANTRVALTDDKGVGITMTEKLAKEKDGITNVIGGYTYSSNDEGKLLYVPKDGETCSGTYYGKAFTLNPEDAATEYKHILKPFAAYSEKIGDMVINYTLDNYVTIYGNVENEETDEEEYVSRAGYLTAPSKISGIEHNSISGIKLNNSEIKAGELLSEQIAYKGSSAGNYTVETFNYVYEAEGNTKVYFDEANRAFIIDNSSIKIYLTEDITRYKKVTIPQYNDNTWTQNEIYQNLFDGRWYKKDDNGKYYYYEEELSYVGVNNEKNYDYSSINYCVESYIFTQWFNNLNLGTELIISDSNDPEDENSDFCIHKKEIIKNVVESNLNQAITSYSRNSEGEYQLPKLTETDWDQILSNVSIITFVQNIPIGMKYYNNYAIATSTVNKEYVDPDEIYLNVKDDNYYHMPYCGSIDITDNIIGYRSIDYVQKSYTKKETGETKYYYKHNNNGTIDVRQACYYCLVQKSLYEEEKTLNKSNAYYTALAREKYVARMSKLPAEVEPGYYIKVTTDPDNQGEIYIEYGGSNENGTGSLMKRIKDTNIGTTYNIFGKSNDIDVGAGSIEEINATETNLDSRAQVGSSRLDEKESYTTSDKISVTIDEYTNAGVKVTYSGIAGDPDYGAGDVDDFGEENLLSAELGTAYVNVKLHYTKNYTSEDDSSAEVWANINNYNNLTIVTKPIKITGRVRLRFTIGEGGSKQTFYSSNTFIVNEGNSIYCEIPNNTEWYNKEWHVDILNVKNESIAGGNVGYYTIRDAQGLKGFANATNEGAKTQGRKFYLINNINMNNSDLNPICQSRSNWFNGYFSGAYNEGLVKAENNHVISNININIIENTSYAFGLFGWVGKPAKIEDLVISDINVDLSDIENKADYKAGGLAGFCDVGESINNVIVQNSTIKGTTYVGGIVGENKKEINNSRISSSTSISSSGTKNDTNKDTYIYVGGIAAKSTANISGCYVENSTVGEGAVNIWSSEGKGYYYVGGIVGYTNGTVISSTLNSSSNIKGGKIVQNNGDRRASSMEEYIEYYETYTGGVIGYKETNQEINSTFQVNCKVEGHDNVGGIVGYNAGGNINGLTRTGEVKGTGENVGGIVGYNDGGNITECNNNATITGTGKNVGGIVGFNKNKNITKCYNNNAVTGNANVGGIVGNIKKGWIKYCVNNGTIIGGKNTNSIIDPNTKVITENWFTSIVEGKLIGTRYITGTGGITGKNNNAKISYSYNAGEIDCNFNGGGIAGITADGTIEYCYNKATIKNIQKDEKVHTSYPNRLGGITGAAEKIKLTACYNIGEIQGKSNISLLSSQATGVGGIIGVLNGNFPDSLIKYCYNTGKVTGDYTHFAIATTHYNGGIVGFVDNEFRGNRFKTFHSCYFLNTSPVSGRGMNSYIDTTDVSGISGMDENTLKSELYTLTNDIIVPEEEDREIAGKYIYNTIAPLETDKGYEGYGVLWWELQDYVKLTSNMFLCIIDEEDNSKTYTGTPLFSTNSYKPKIILNDKEIDFDSLPATSFKMRKRFVKQ